VVAGSVPPPRCWRRRFGAPRAKTWQRNNLARVGATPALIAAAAGVGFGHAVLPDHWVPLAVLGRTRRYPIARVARLSGLASVAHVLVSLILGALVIVIGLQFRSSVEQDRGGLSTAAFCSPVQGSSLLIVVSVYIRSVVEEQGRLG